MAGPDAPVAGRERLTRDARRDQLLDCAAVLTLDAGVTSVTMEGVAARAGVSKALPYAHFDNARDLLTALRDRELARFSHQVATAVRAATGLEAKVAAAVHAHFDEICERGAVLEILLRSVPVDQDRRSERDDYAFFAHLFARHGGVSPPRARVAAALFVAGMPGAVDSWLRRDAGRATVEATVTRLVVAGITALTDDEAAGLVPVRRPR